jgi:trehalose-6-phosphatase
MDKRIREIPPIRPNGRATIIGVDFDGTLCEHKYPDIGKPYIEIIDTLVHFRKYGGKLILWTCRNGKDLEDAINWCQQFGLFFDAINEDTKEVKETDFGKEKSVKVCADFYFDDRNL